MPRKHEKYEQNIGNNGYCLFIGCLYSFEPDHAVKPCHGG
jgi:hypothetical protein